jgi:2'-5' RNA ligase
MRNRISSGISSPCWHRRDDLAQRAHVPATPNPRHRDGPPPSGLRADSRGRRLVARGGVVCGDPTPPDASCAVYAVAGRCPNNVSLLGFTSSIENDNDPTPFTSSSQPHSPNAQKLRSYCPAARECRSRRACSLAMPRLCSPTRRDYINRATCHNKHALLQPRAIIDRQRERPPPSLPRQPIMRCPVPRKTHTTAVVLIPPTGIWTPIQAIRQVHDRHVRRWMPHITLLYPFRPHNEFDSLAGRFSAVCERLERFSTTFTEIRYFRHRRDSYTLWLAPEPKEAFVRLQALIERVVPECNDVSQHREGFTPHLSIGQVRGERELFRLKEALQAAWQPLAFTACEISLIWRGEPPDDVFRIGKTVELTR